MTKLWFESVNFNSIKRLLNYRVIFVYFMTYICMHYYVANKVSSQSDSSLQLPLNSNYKAEIYIKKRHLNVIQQPRRFLLQKEDYFLVSKSKRNTKPEPIYSASDKSVILNTLKRNQKLIVDKSLNGKSKVLLKRDSQSTDLKFDYNHGLNYNLKNKSIKFSSQILQDKILIHLLNTTYLNSVDALKKGFFVEAGAYDGETWSNTLMLERFYNWTGLLIEPSTENYKKLMSKNRNAYSINSCLCAGKSSIKSDYIEAGPFGITTNVSMSQSSDYSSQSVSSIHSVTCHPLEKLLNKFFEKNAQFMQKKSRISPYVDTKVPVIDYMSLDIEGSEKSVVESFPWNEFQINFLNIEYNQNKEMYKWLKTYLEKFGYLETVIDDIFYQDIYLAHKSVYSYLNMNNKLVSKFINS